MRKIILNTVLIENFKEVIEVCNKQGNKILGPPGAFPNNM